MAAPEEAAPEEAAPQRPVLTLAMLGLNHPPRQARAGPAKVGSLSREARESGVRRAEYSSTLRSLMDDR